MQCCKLSKQGDTTTITQEQQKTFKTGCEEVSPDTTCITTERMGSLYKSQILGGGKNRQGRNVAILQGREKAKILSQP